MLHQNENFLPADGSTAEHLENTFIHWVTDETTIPTTAYFSCGITA